MDDSNLHEDDIMKPPPLQTIAPPFEGVISENPIMIRRNLDYYKGKYLVLFFYPLEYYYHRYNGWPPEYLEFCDACEEFRSYDCEIIAVSTLRHKFYMQWVKSTKDSEGNRVKNLPFYSDTERKTVKAYGILNQKTGKVYKGWFIIDDRQILRSSFIKTSKVGLSVSETLLLVQSCQIFDKCNNAYPESRLRNPQFYISDYISKSEADVLHRAAKRVAFCCVSTEGDSSVKYNPADLPALQAPAPAVEGLGVVNKRLGRINLENYKGKYVVLFFYPLGFVHRLFGLPEEYMEFIEGYHHFKSVNCELITISTQIDPMTYLNWLSIPRTNGGLGDINMPLIFDSKLQIVRKYGAINEQTSTVHRGLFIVDDKQIVRMFTVNEYTLELSVEETLVLIQGCQLSDYCDYGGISSCSFTRGIFGCKK